MKLDIQQAIIELNQLAQGGVYKMRGKDNFDVIDSCDGNLKEAVHVFDPNLSDPLLFILNNAAQLVEALHQVSPVTLEPMKHVPPPLTPEQQISVDSTLGQIFGEELDIPEFAYTNFPLADAPRELAMFERIAPGLMGDWDYTPTLKKDEHGRHEEMNIRAAWMGWQQRAQIAQRRPMDMLVAYHAEALQVHPYAYFELAYSRSTGWMAWVCTNVINRDKRRHVLAVGGGATPDEACRYALANMKNVPETAL
uniref:Uncharacterized protein n=1 Tax=Pseudomonas phage Cygsa01 TaxID=3138529 RepID=A0AAU6W3X8_9VIRU